MGKLVIGGNSRKLLLQMLSPNNPSFLSPTELEICKMVSGFSSSSPDVVMCSKKDVETRGVELSLAFIDDLSSTILGENFASLCGNKLSADVLVEFIRFICYGQKKGKDGALVPAVTRGKKELLFANLLQRMTTDLPSWTNRVGHMTIKKIVQILGDFERHEHGADVECPECHVLVSLIHTLNEAEDSLIGKLLDSPATWIFAKLVELEQLRNKNELVSKLKRVIQSQEGSSSSAAGLQTLRKLLEL
jgi:hypothetical protein